MHPSFSLPSLASLKNRFAVSLSAILNVAWWVLLALLAAFLFLDGLFFYLYGLGYAEPPSSSGLAPETVRVREGSIRKAASLLQQSSDTFEKAAPAPPDLPDPFR